MLKNYLKIALRSAKRHGGITLLNILGLAIGLACFSRCFLYRQLSSDKDSFGYSA